MISLPLPNKKIKFFNTTYHDDEDDRCNVKDNVGNSCRLLKGHVGGCLYYKSRYSNSREDY